MARRWLSLARSYEFSEQLTPQLSIEQLAAKFTPISLNGATGTPAVSIDPGGYDR